MPLLTFDWFFVPLLTTTGWSMNTMTMMMLMMMRRRCSSCRLGSLCLDFTFVTPAPQTFEHMYVFQMKTWSSIASARLARCSFSSASTSLLFSLVFFCGCTVLITYCTMAAKRSKNFEVAPFEMLYRFVSNRIVYVCVCVSVSLSVSPCLSVRFVNISYYAPVAVPGPGP